MQRSALCRSRRELSNAYLLAKIGVDTAENESLEVWGKIQFIIHLPPYVGDSAASCPLLFVERFFLFHLCELAPVDELWPEDKDACL